MSYVKCNMLDHQKIKVQRGSEIPTSLDFQMAQKRLGCKWSGFWKEYEIQMPNHWKSRQNSIILSENFLKSRQKCPDFEWSGFQLVGTIAIVIPKAPPFEIWKHSKSHLQKVQIKCQIVKFQIPAVFRLLLSSKNYLDEVCIFWTCSMNSW